MFRLFQVSLVLRRKAHQGRSARQHVAASRSSLGTVTCEGAESGTILKSGTNVGGSSCPVYSGHSWSTLNAPPSGDTSGGGGGKGRGGVGDWRGEKGMGRGERLTTGQAPAVYWLPTGPPPPALRPFGGQLRDGNRGTPTCMSPPTSNFPPLVAGIFNSCETFEFLWHSSIIMQKHSELFENSPIIYG